MVQAVVQQWADRGDTKLDCCAFWYIRDMAKYLLDVINKDILSVVSAGTSKYLLAFWLDCTITA